MTQYQYMQFFIISLWRSAQLTTQDDAMTLKHYRRYWLFMQGIQWTLVTCGPMALLSHHDNESVAINRLLSICHDDVIKWKHFPRYWPFVGGNHRSPVNSPHKGQWRGALMFSLICVWINDWVNDCKAGDLRRHRDHYDVIVMLISVLNYNSTFHCISCFLIRIWIQSLMNGICCTPFINPGLCS